MVSLQYVKVFAGLCLLTPVFLHYTSSINHTLSFIIYHSVGTLFSSLSTLIPPPPPPPPRIFAFFLHIFFYVKSYLKFLILYSRGS